jgi:hypothetical protein
MFPTIPRGEVIGRYEDYLDAQKIVDYLADNDFPVAHVSIIGNDLKLVERVRNKLSYPRVAMQGASQGAVIGLFFGLLLMLFSPGGDSTPLSIIAAVLMGAVIFMMMSVISYALQRGKRDFSSTRQVLPSTWDVVVDRNVAAQAKQLASRLPMRPAQAGAVSGWGAPQQGGAPQGPAAPAPSPEQPTPGQKVEQPSVPSADFNDLADGRPRYGVRVQQPQQPVSDEAGSAQSAPNQSAPNLGGEFRPQVDQADQSDQAGQPNQAASRPHGDADAEADSGASGTEQDKPAETPEQDEQERDER